MARYLCGYRVGEGPVLVTGAGGFVGRTLMERFNLGAGDYATDFSSDFSAPEGVAKIAWELPGPPPSSLGEVRHVVHLAGLSSVAHSLEGEERVVDVNGRGTGSVAEWVREKSPGARLLLAGSSEVYKPSVSRLTEDSRLEPRSPYGHSKLLAESILSSSGTDWLVSRSFPHFGPGQQGHFVLPSFCRRIITAIRMGHREMVTGNLQAVRDYLYIDDVVRAYACILARGRSGGIYNVCSGEGHSIGELLEMLLSIGGCDIEVKTDPDLLRTGDQFCQVGEPSKLRELGWKEEYSLKRGLELLYRWWEERL